MATQALFAVADYLQLSFSDHGREYCNGEVVDRGMSTYMHARLQALLSHLFFRLAETHRLFPASGLRIEVEKGAVYRIPDVCLFEGIEPSGGVVDFPPLVAVEISSPEDRLSETMRKFAEYQAFGIQNIWLIEGERKQFFAYDAAGLHPVKSLGLAEFGFEIDLRKLGLAE